MSHQELYRTLNPLKFRQIHREKVSMFVRSDYSNIPNRLVYPDIEAVSFPGGTHEGGWVVCAIFLFSNDWLMPTCRRHLRRMWHTIATLAWRAKIGNCQCYRAFLKNVSGNFWTSSGSKVELRSRVVSTSKVPQRFEALAGIIVFSIAGFAFIFIQVGIELTCQGPLRENFQHRSECSVLAIKGSPDINCFKAFFLSSSALILFFLIHVVSKLVIFSTLTQFILHLTRSPDFQHT